MKFDRFVMIAATLAVLIASPALANEPATAGTTAKKMHHHHMWMDKMDTNHDGVISKDEWNSFHRAMFDKIDTNHDGKITKDEFKANRMAMMEKHREWKSKHGGGSTSMPPANNQAGSSGVPSGGADGAGGWTAQ